MEFDPLVKLSGRAILAFAALAVVGVATRTARADVIYTYHDTQGGGATGYLQVTDAAVTDGEITLSNVDAFSFYFDGHTEALSNLIASNSIDIPISMSNAAPDGAYSYFYAGALQIYLDSGYATGPEPVEDMSGYTGGYWTFQTAPSAVPEPSSLVLCGLAGLSAAGYGLRRAVKSRRASHRLAT